MIDFTPILARCKGGEAPKVLPKSHGIYILRNLTNGKFYVGSTVNLRRRCHQHFEGLRSNRHHNPHLQSAWNKYGAPSFEFLVVEIIDSTPEILVREQAWIDALGAATSDDCYNFCAKAGSHLGRKRSEETRRKLSVANTGKRHSEQAKQKMRDAKLGRKLSEEHKRKVGDAARGKKLPPRSEESKWHRRILTVEQVVEFRSLRAQGWTLHQLARHFGTGFSLAQRIAAGKSYQGVQ